MSNERQEFFSKIKHQTEQCIKKGMHLCFLFDATEVTSQKSIYNLLDEHDDYVKGILQIASTLSKKYGNSMIVYVISDELNICITDMPLFLSFFPKDHIFHIGEIRDFLIQEICLLSVQYHKQPVFFHGWTMQIYPDLIHQFLLWRKHRGSNSMMHYYAIKNGISMDHLKNLSYKQCIEYLSTCTDINSRTAWQQYGDLYVNGISYNPEEFLNGSIWKYESSVKPIKYRRYNS